MYIDTAWLWARRFYKLLLFETIEKIIKIFAKKAIGQYLCNTLYNNIGQKSSDCHWRNRSYYNDEIIFQWCEWYNLTFNFDYYKLLSALHTIVLHTTYKCIACNMLVQKFLNFIFWVAENRIDSKEGHFLCGELYISLNFVFKWMH